MSTLSLTLPVFLHLPTFTISARLLGPLGFIVQTFLLWTFISVPGLSSIRVENPPFCKAETLAVRARPHPSATPIQDTGPDEDCTEEQGWQGLLDSSVVASRGQH